MYMYCKGDSTAPTAGSSKLTLEIKLLSHSLSLLPVLIYVLNSWAYSGPDSGHSAGLCDGVPILDLQAGVSLPTHGSPAP